jgi:molybdopterin synthase catalytic subunit
MSLLVSATAPQTLPVRFSFAASVPHQPPVVILRSRLPATCYQLLPVAYCLRETSNPLRFTDNKERMRVTLLAFGLLRDHLPNPAGSLELPAGATVRDLLERCRALAPANAAPWSSIAVAVNQEYVPATHPLADGDEVALLPPVSGGSGKAKQAQTQASQASTPNIALTHYSIEPSAITRFLKRGEDGAVVLFDGIVRNNSRGRRTLHLFYEAYEEMALAQMHRLAAQALADYAIRDLAIVHRLGRLDIGETSVVIAVSSAHRAAAFDACRWLIDTLKQTVPIWKQEFFEDGAVWAQGDPFPPELTPHSAKPHKLAATPLSKKPAPKKISAKTVKSRKPERAR